MTTPIAALWRRLDVPGHDGCQFLPGEDGWTLRGSATGYEYEAPSAGYRGTLEFSAQGIIVDYPELFTRVGGT